MEKAKEINILALCKSLLRKAWLIVLCAVVFGIGGYIYTDQCVDPMYRSSILLYVNNSARTDDNDNISSSDLATSQRLVKTYIIILRSDPVMDKVAANLERSTGKKLSGAAINGMISAGAEDDTEVFRVSVSNTDPVLAAEVANSVAAVAPKEIETVILGSSAKVVQQATVARAPYAPNKTRQAALVAVIGAVLAIAFVLIREFMDVRIKSEEDLAEICDAPILGYIPELNMESSTKYSYTPQGKEEVGK